MRKFVDVMIDKLINFPIWKDDGKAVKSLNNLQKKQIKNFINRVNSEEYKFVDNPCLCGNTDKNLDIIISQKDRYGIPCKIVLCKKCGLIRLKERLDDCSTAQLVIQETGINDASGIIFSNMISCVHESPKS